MASKLDTFVQHIADTVPFVVDIRIEHSSMMGSVTIILECVDGLVLRQAYGTAEIERIPHQILCDYLTCTVHKIREAHLQKEWHAQKQDLGHGIAICQAGAFKAQMQIQWPPPPFLRFTIPSDEGKSQSWTAMLRSPNNATRVAQYGDII